ncbi:MAG: hypothetical protein KUG72_05930 [Pseudomonadales bacterium]|nr:hypothetical protein [Pseudomonadales bacterium]
MNKYCLYFLCVVLLGCDSRAKYEDVSSADKYLHLISTSYRTMETLVIHGTSLGVSKEKRIDVYDVSRKPGSGGRYIVKRINLEAGSDIKILSVLQCTNCGDARYMFAIDILSKELDPVRPIYLVGLGSIDTQGRLILDLDIFSTIDGIRLE